MTFPAGLEAQRISGKPLVIHVHSLEMDRTGGNGANPYVYEVEKKTMQKADRIITVSNWSKTNIVKHYGIPAGKINVAYNAIDAYKYSNSHHKMDINKHFKIVLFLGRITLQKGPDYFIYTAKRVLEKYKDAVFVLAGSGDMQTKLIEKAAQLGISDRVFFTGYLPDEEIDKLMKSASVLVMPSVSEPFGLVALEAMVNKIPLIISKQSGVIEVVNHCMKVDFWDVDEMANKIVALLEYDTLNDSIRENGYHDVEWMSWDAPARSCISVYENVLGGM